ncbi:hypothetical protein SCT_3134 [Sulfuricella sp. T08]|uniref:DUF3025 domain-containing protein n=1 Tax=Sulfuricella sp. T08 TaxID=1632857 RepID=UPI000617A05C|nr:DUF3025 domain-containing protein [Sulfuricella sp. T08]GAO37698.1 hypothetical protein SCT_3134 [Sulfuricella sp. T08]
MTSVWDAAWYTLSPIYQPLLEAAHSLGTARESWPDLDDYNRLLQSAAVPVLTHSGKPVHCVPQADDNYEQRTYLTGEVQTRSHNWHDLFNTLVWRVFPRTKAAVNLMHYRTSQGKLQPTVGRGTARDVLTLFDESGVVIACAQDELGRMLRQHQWKSLFWQRRSEVSVNMKFIVFGHSLYEKALRPYIGLTGKALILPVAPGFLTLPLARQLAETDAMMAEHLLGPDSLQTTSSLSPLPLLGVPDWWPDNNHEIFYENTRYFRPAPTGKNSG